ncbi:MAG TPA: DUF4124 domain-containing protein [Xanthomonadales bacterium]|nr:DUF4124 domain-containing protein [Xanthomonadales bacterium]
MTIWKLTAKCLAGALLTAPLLHAAEIYHWVDADGISHYSQSPPPSDSGEVETLEVDGSQPASYDPNEDRYNVAAQEAAMQEMRDKMAENRKNKEKQASSTQNTVIYYPQEESYGQILYPPGYWNDRPIRPGNRPRPPKPVQPLPKPNPPAIFRPNRP